MFHCYILYLCNIENTCLVFKKYIIHKWNNAKFEILKNNEIRLSCTSLSNKSIFTTLFVILLYLTYFGSVSAKNKVPFLYALWTSKHNPKVTSSITSFITSFSSS